MFASHHWPRWGNAAHPRGAAGTARRLRHHQQPVCCIYANQGVTINQIHNVYEVPKGIQQQWHTRGYHGSPENNARACDTTATWGTGMHEPRHPDPALPRADSGAAFCRDDGWCGDAIHGQRHASCYEARASYRLASRDPEQAGAGRAAATRPAKDLLADVFEQIGYQQENPGLRNSFLAGALRASLGHSAGCHRQRPLSPDVIRAMSTELCSSTSLGSAWTAARPRVSSSP